MKTPPLFRRMSRFYNDRYRQYEGGNDSDDNSEIKIDWSVVTGIALHENA